MYIHTYIHTYTYIHTHTYICIHMHTYAYICIHMHTYAYIYIHIHTYTYIYIHIHTYTYIYIYIHIHIHIHIDIHIHIHVHIHIHTHTYTYRYTYTYTYTYIHIYVSGWNTMTSRRYVTGFMVRKRNLRIISESSPKLLLFSGWITKKISQILYIPITSFKTYLGIQLIYIWISYMDMVSIYIYIHMIWYPNICQLPHDIHFISMFSQVMLDPSLP